MSSDVPPDPTARLDALRALGAERRDPLGWAYVEALARRRAALPEPARRLIDQRLEQALQACRQALDTAPTGRSPAPAHGPLAGLLAGLAQAEATEGTAPVGTDPELRAVARFRGRWERMGVEQRLADARATLPANAGPLNSDGLVSRALALMREVSPAYLQRFVSHVDALMWLESALAVLPGAAATRERSAAEPPGPPSRPRSAARSGARAASSKRAPRPPRTRG